MKFKQIANYITLGNLFCGLLAILLVIDGQCVFGAWLIIIAVGFDIIDGQVARRYKITSELGKELDSLSDLVSFGVAPLILLYMMDNQILQVALIPLSIYLFCAAYRLARFNVSSNNGPSDFFEGLPITAAGGSIASIFLVLQEVNLNLNSYLFLILVVILALLMISKIKYPNFKKEKILKLKYLIGLAVVLICLIFASALTVCLFFLIYVVFSPLKLKAER